MPTLAQGIEALADQFGSRLYSTISSTAVSGEPGRWLVIDALKDDERQRSQFAGGYVHMVNGALVGQDRRIRDEGYEGPSGALAVSRVFQVGTVPTNPSADDLVQITEPLPWSQVGMMRGYAQLWNEGLARVWTEARVTFTGNGTSRYSMAAYPEFATQALIDGLYDWTTGIATTEPPILSSITPTITTNGATITLDTGWSYSTAATFQLKVFVRANTLVYDSGTNAWGFSGNGLVNDADQAAVPIKWGLPVAMVKAIQYRTRQIMADKSTTKDEKAALLATLPDPKSRQSWARAAANIIQERLPRPTAPSSQGLASIPIPYADAPLVGGSGWPN